MAATAPRTAAYEPAGGPLAMVPVRVEDVAVRLFRPTTLEHVDATALLRDEAALEPPYWMHLWPGSVAVARRVAGEARR